MNGRGPEHLEQETLEEKMKKVEGLENSDNPDAKRGFNDLASELGKPESGKYSTDELIQAADKKVQKMTTGKLGNLNEAEKMQLDTIKEGMFSSLKGKDNTKEFLAEYSKIRDKIAGIIAVADGGKQQATEESKQRLMSTENKSKDMTQDAFDKFKELLNTALERKQKEQEKALQQAKDAQNNANATNGLGNPPYGREVLAETESSFALA